ncbi:hypothetical protein [Tateyamaria sp. Alg231-49]|uniref:hypothetical protein n=1 Tax=Tateyamaria sp. Alg231-49 TaxID=1922219 RepID=UPI00131EE99D|nr:hypothetical protein [Tateyamaria sp. Alg231-49]
MVTSAKLKQMLFLVTIATPQDGSRASMVWDASLLRSAMSGSRSIASKSGSAV